MKPEILDILRHSLGVNAPGRTEMYRNHFVTGQYSIDHANCMSAVEAGFMTRRSGSPITGGDDLFVVTEAGKEVVRDHLKSIPSLTRSQQRYRRYLRADSNLKFGEWIKRYG